MKHDLARDSDSSATASVSSPIVSGGNGVQRVFANWGGDASGVSASISIIMNNAKSATANWLTQFLVTTPSMATPYLSRFPKTNG